MKRKANLHNASPSSSLRLAAIRLLANREHSAKELAQKLEKVCCDKDLVAYVVSSLHKEDLQSDDRFTEVFVRSRINKGYGPLKIRFELVEKGISNDLIAEHLLNSMIDWETIVQSQFKKRFYNLDIGDPKAKAKVLRFFKSRGFLFDHLKYALL